MNNFRVAALLGQGLSVGNALSGALTTSIARRGISLPGTQALLFNLFLATVYGVYLITKRQPLKEAWWKFACVQLTECLATYASITAFSFTSITSVTLLLCFSVPCVLVLSQIILGAKYKTCHWIGAIVCMAGLAILVVSDKSEESNSQSPRPILGDSLALLAACLYAITHVLQEKLLGIVDIAEFLTWAGIFGTLYYGFVALVFELKIALHAPWSAQVISLIIAFDASCFIYLSTAPLVLIWGGASLLNLSLLSSDLWAALARLLLFGGFSLASALFFLLSSTLVAIGLILYNKEEATYKHKTFHEPLKNPLPQSDNSIELEPLHIDKQHLLSGNYKENLPEVVVDKKHPQENPSESHHTWPAKKFQGVRIPEPLDRPGSVC